jgi:hypothetical protein
MRKKLTQSAKKVLIELHIQNQNRSHNSDIEVIGYEDEAGRYIIMAIGSQWFVIESVVVANKVLENFKIARDIVWPLASDNNLKKYEILAKESDPKTSVESRIDKES